LAWAFLGIVGVLVVGYIVFTELTVVIVPIVLAVFVAGVLEPVSHGLRALGLPGSLAALLALVLAVVVVGGVVALIVPAFHSQLPALIDSLHRAVGRLQTQVAGFFGSRVALHAVVSQAVAKPVSGGGSRLGAALGTTMTVLTGVVLVLVFAFFYLAEGRWLVNGFIGWFPRVHQPMLHELGQQVWLTVGRYVRGILLVALADAIGIGAGLFALGVPLALPLTVLVYLGAFVPIVGAFVTGLLAVLIAFAGGGIWVAVAALGVVVAVQQLEGNVLQPLIIGRVIQVPAFVMLVAAAVGFAWLGLIGGFLAAPIAGAFARVVEYFTDRNRASAPPSRRT
jgi:predicted PurR-regulated permease PerM